MNYSGRPSPKKSPRSVTSESIALAEDLLKSCDVTNIDSSQVSSALQGIQALRHRAMIANEKPRVKKCDFLISELNNIINRPKPTTPKREKWTPRTVKSRQAQPVPQSCSPRPVEITEDEQNHLESVVDSLLNGCEIDTIDPVAVPKLEVVLKARKAKAVEESDYETAKLLDNHLASLPKVLQEQSSIGFKSPIALKSWHDRDLVLDAEGKLRNARKRLDRLKADLEEEKARIANEREESQSQIFAAIEAEVNGLEDEKLDLELGVGFKASKRLLELRAQESLLAKNSEFDEAAVVKKNADFLEMQERREFDRYNKSQVLKREKAQKKLHEMKIRQNNEFWDNLLEKTQQKAESNMKTIEDEIEAIKGWIKKITGKEYIEPDTTSDVTSELNFDNYEEEETKEETSSKHGKKSDTRSIKSNKVTPNRRENKKAEAIPIPTVIVNTPSQASPRSGSVSPRSAKSGQNSPRSPRSPRNNSPK